MQAASTLQRPDMDDGGIHFAGAQAALYYEKAPTIFVEGHAPHVPAGVVVEVELRRARHSAAT